MAIIYKTKSVKVSLVAETTEIPKMKVQSSKDARDYARNLYNSDILLYESFFIIALNRANNTIGHAKISQGGISSTTVDVRLIAKYAVEMLATSVILVHNHPSGNINPSGDDINLTSKIKAGLKLLNIDVLDHIILTDGDVYSMADNSLI